MPAGPCQPDPWSPRIVRRTIIQLRRTGIPLIPVIPVIRTAYGLAHLGHVRAGFGLTTEKCSCMIRAANLYLPFFSVCKALGMVKFDRSIAISSLANDQHPTDIEFDNVGQDSFSSIKRPSCLRCLRPFPICICKALPQDEIELNTKVVNHFHRFVSERLFHIFFTPAGVGPSTPLRMPQKNDWDGSFA